MDTDLDGIPDCFDNCPTIPNADQNPCVCEQCGVTGLAIDFSSPEGRGSGVVTWSTEHEVDIVGFNLFMVDQQGTRTRLNPVVIPCEECVTGAGHTYTYIIPKHKSGHNIFLDLLRLSGSIQTFGPALKR